MYVYSNESWGKKIPTQVENPKPSASRVPTAQGKWQKKSLSGKTQGIWKFCQNTGNLVCSSCKFPDSKGKRYFDFCHENV